MVNVAFVGQARYFQVCYENDLDDVFDKVYKFDIDPVLHSFDRYKQLLNYSDVDVWIFKRGEYIPIEVLDNLSGIKIWYSTEPIERSEVLPVMHKGYRDSFDYFVHYDSSHVNTLNNEGFGVYKTFPLPVATDTYKPLGLEKKWDVVFFGRPTSRREQVLRTIMKDYRVLWISEGMYGTDEVELLNKARFGINIHISPFFKQLENRIQTMMSVGLLVFSEPLTNNDYFVPGEHYVEFYDPDDFKQKFVYYKDHPVEARKIAEAGRKLVLEKLSAKKVWKELVDEVLKNGQD